jgi:putative ABC transport system substrate-binding protein
MRSRGIIVALGTAGAMPLATRAQQRATPQRMAMFHPAIPPALLTETGGGSAWRAFFGELRRLGYVEGQNLIIERYWAEDDRYADVSREILARNPDVIVTGMNPVVSLFKATIGAIPIVPS